LPDEGEERFILMKEGRKEGNEQTLILMSGSSDRIVLRFVAIA
jgi:hypothetical protein